MNGWWFTVVEKDGNWRAVVAKLSGKTTREVKIVDLILGMQDPGPVGRAACVGRAIEELEHYAMELKEYIPRLDQDPVPVAKPAPKVEDTEDAPDAAAPSE